MAELPSLGVWKGYRTAGQPCFDRGDLFDDIMHANVASPGPTAAVAAGEKSSLAPLRAIQHKDALGNPIGMKQASRETGYLARGSKPRM